VGGFRPPSQHPDGTEDTDESRSDTNRNPAEKYRLLYCTDLSDAASTTLPYAAGLARHIGSSVFALHVRPIVQPFVAPPFGGPMEPMMPGPTETEIREGIAKELIIVLQGSAPDHILSVANQRKTDLIIIGVRRPGGFATHLPIATAHKIVSNATCPILTVRA
jgi:nucleotide-binding universal stress UspA family protein